MTEVKDLAGLVVSARFENLSEQAVQQLKIGDSRGSGAGAEVASRKIGGLGRVRAQRIASRSREASKFTSKTRFLESCARGPAFGMSAGTDTICIGA